MSSKIDLLRQLIREASVLLEAGRVEPGQMRQWLIRDKNYLIVMNQTESGMWEILETDSAGEVQQYIADGRDLEKNSKPHPVKLPQDVDFKDLDRCLDDLEKLKQQLRGASEAPSS